MTIKEMKARLRQIGVEAKQVADGDVETLNRLADEAEGLENSIAEAENRARLSKYADNAAEGEEGAGESGESSAEEAAKRGKALLAGDRVSRKFAVKNAITSSSTVLTHHNAEDVNPAFGEVSSLLDRVKIVPLNGGESYRRGFVKSYGEGGYTAEGAAATTAEPTFGYAEITKAKITAYCEEPEEISKLAPSAYDDVIGNSTEIAIRKKITKQILVGDGSSNSIKGIFYNPTKTADDIIDRSRDISVTAIDENTLDEIIYAYGGDEEVGDEAVLILSKADLKAFATCRLDDGKKAYTVVNRGNTGTIDGIPYIINSACKAISAAATTAGSYAMAYGSLSGYELAVFSDISVERSKEYKFKEGQTAFRGDVFIGGNVAAYNGFVRVKKGAAATTPTTGGGEG